MSDTNVAKRYAEAFIDVAVEANAVDALGADLTKVTAALRANDGQLADALSSPVFSNEERANVLKAVLPMLQIQPLTANLLNVVGDNKRFSAFNLISEHYQALADEKNGRVRATVVTAEAMSPQLENEVKAALETATGKTVLIEHSIDASLIGGMVARVGGTVYDSSLRTRLEQLKQTLVSAQA